jgi:hypothetical protein
MRSNSSLSLKGMIWSPTSPSSLPPLVGCATAICGAPSQFEDSNEDSEDKDPYEGLRNEIGELKMKNNMLE